MTLILAIPAADGIVLASDGQVTAGPVRATGTKIWSLNEKCVWDASGELALIQRVEERFQTLQRQESIVGLRDSIGQIVKQCVTELLQMDFRTAFVPQNPDLLLQLHLGDFVFAEFSDKPYILHVMINGIPEWVKDRSFASGSGDLFAYALLQKYVGRKIDLEGASLLAYKVIEEAIEVGAYGLGPPIGLWKVTNDRAWSLSEDEIAVLKDSARALREGEIQMLLGQVEQDVPPE